MPAKPASITISLLTCGPGNEVYNLFGHTALRYQDRSRGEDLVINYGMFSFKKPYFVLRFVFGLTDYEMGIESFDDFFAQYSNEGRSIIQQELDLTPEEKLRIARAIDENYLPENRVYRYNYFYDNCTTRARDMIIGHLDGKVSSSDRKVRTLTYREMVHQWDKTYPWVMFGNDVLLGMKADFKTTAEQQEFLPDNLRRDFDHAYITASDGSTHKLVSRTETLLKQQIHPHRTSFPLRPIECSFILLSLTAICLAIERFLHCNLWLFDTSLMVSCGLAGIILTAMVFSQHPTVSLNLQILVLNPLPLLFIWPAIKALRRKQRYWLFPTMTVMTLLFFIGNFIQGYAEGMNIVALSLLIRHASALRFTTKKK
uniref:Lnb N-terminal periplasmic domain-containing protein n=1 Tax=Hoylesella pleuritidis TaxID=407975 RepID=UPI001F599445|nr:DUF4105 domain-containing protein [Hoylesella pleuritidis]